jgi:hypothetical protein
MTGGVAGELTARLAFDPQVNRQGPGPNQGHVALEDIQELRQFIQAKGTEKLADRCDTLVASLDRLPGIRVGTRVVECTKLENFEFFVVEAKPLLSEQNGARTGEFHKERY